MASITQKFVVGMYAISGSLKSSPWRLTNQCNSNWVSVKVHCPTIHCICDLSFYYNMSHFCQSIHGDQYYICCNVSKPVLKLYLHQHLNHSCVIIIFYIYNDQTSDKDGNIISHCIKLSKWKGNNCVSQIRHWIVIFTGIIRTKNVENTPFQHLISNGFSS